MATRKKKTEEHEIVYKALANSRLTKEMVDWLIEHGKKLDDNIKYHDPLFVECVKTLKPSEFGVTKITGNKYKVIDLTNDSIIMTPNDIKILNKSWTVIGEDEGNADEAK